MAGFTMTERAMTDEERAAWRESASRRRFGRQAGFAVGAAAALAGGLLGLLLAAVLALLFGRPPVEAARWCAAGVLLGSASAGYLAFRQFHKSMLKVGADAFDGGGAQVYRGHIAGALVVGPSAACLRTLLLESTDGHLLVLRGCNLMEQLQALPAFPHANLELVVAKHGGDCLGYRGEGDELPLGRREDGWEGLASLRVMHGDQFPGHLATWQADLEAEFARRRPPAE